MNKILIVNNKKYITNTIKEFLSRKGYDVFTAAVGDVAIRRLKKIRPSHVILGVFMYKIGVFDILKTIKNIDPQIIVIIIIGLPDIELAKEAFRLGAHDFFVTPINLQHIESIIKRSCSKPDIRVE